MIPAHLMWAEESEEVRTGGWMSSTGCVSSTPSPSPLNSLMSTAPKSDGGCFIWWNPKRLFPKLSKEKKQEVLGRLIQVDTFEKFLHRTFVGQKRFSIEGVDMMVPMLDQIIHYSVHGGVKDVMIGMAHRGRLERWLTCWANPMRPFSPSSIMLPTKSWFPQKGSMGLNYGWTGDVKYHLGGNREVDPEDPNPPV